MKRTTTTPKLALYFRPWTPGQYDIESASHYSFDIVRLDETDGKPRNISCDTWNSEGISHLHNLEISCFLSWSSGRFSADSCWETSYRQGWRFVDLRKAELMVKGLKKVERIAERFPVRPATFGQYVVLMAKGLGVKQVAIATSTGGWSYTDCSFRFEPIAAAAEMIDNEIDRVRRSVLGLEAAA